MKQNVIDGWDSLLPHCTTCISHCTNVASVLPDVLPGVGRFVLSLLSPLVPEENVLE